MRPTPPKAPDAAAAVAPAPAAAAGVSTGVTVEYQRQQAKAMQAYFKSLKFDEKVEQAKVLGWTKRNEISNGRWVMFGVAVGLLTEYATGVSFVEQLKITVSFLGILDLE